MEHFFPSQLCSIRPPPTQTNQNFCSFLVANICSFRSLISSNPQREISFTNQLYMLGWKSFFGLPLTKVPTIWLTLHWMRIYLKIPEAGMASWGIIEYNCLSEMIFFMDFIIISCRNRNSTLSNSTNLSPNFEYPPKEYSNTSQQNAMQTANPQPHSQEATKNSDTTHKITINFTSRQRSAVLSRQRKNNRRQPPTKTELLIFLYALEVVAFSTITKVINVRYTDIVKVMGMLIINKHRRQFVNI